MLGRKPSSKWTPEEDAQLIELVNKLGMNSWTEIASHMANRQGKQCRERYRNQLDPTIKKEPFSKEEDDHVIKMVKEIGTRWARIAEDLPGRTENNIKNRFYCSLHKRMGKVPSSKTPAKKKSQRTRAPKRNRDDDVATEPAKKRSRTPRAARDDVEEVLDDPAFRPSHRVEAPLAPTRRPRRAAAMAVPASPEHSEYEEDDDELMEDQHVVESDNYSDGDDEEVFISKKAIERNTMVSLFQQAPAPYQPTELEHNYWRKRFSKKSPSGVDVLAMAAAWVDDHVMTDVDDTTPASATTTPAASTTTSVSEPAPLPPKKQPLPNLESAMMQDTFMEVAASELAAVQQKNKEVHVDVHAPQHRDAAGWLNFLDHSRIDVA